MAAPSPQDLAAGVPGSANIVKRVPAPSGKGELLLDANGGVYDTGGQSFSGSYHSLGAGAKLGDRQGFKDIIVDPNTGGYKIVSGRGENYDFGPSDFVKNQPKANPLYSDPAFLSFLANSGIAYETAAADVAKRKSALQNALTLNQGSVKEQGAEKLKNVYNDFAARGLSGQGGQVAGQQVEKEGQVQASTLGELAQNEANTANQIGELEGDLVQKRQDILTQAANKGADTAHTQDLGNRLKDIDRKYPGYSSTSSGSAY